MNSGVDTLAPTFTVSGCCTFVPCPQATPCCSLVRYLFAFTWQCCPFSLSNLFPPLPLSSWISKGNIANILVNNTGGPPGGPIAEARTEDFEKTFRQHLICNHILAQAFLPGMKSSGYGRIINIISTSVKQPLHGLGVSNTIRAAVAETLRRAITGRSC